MNGVLPQPWLPLKKGQTLANFVDHDVDTNANTVQNGRRNKNKPDVQGEAVVLTMRRRVSVMRKDVRHFAGRLIGKGGAREGEDDATVAVSNTSDEGEGHATVPRPPSDAGSNPWREAAPGPSQPVPSASYPRARRLSYDAATGVMNLSDDDDGFAADAADEDSDEDVRTSGGNTPGDEEAPTNYGATSDSAPRVGRRRSTYWHHPDRKRVSGTFV